MLEKDFLKQIDKYNLEEKKCILAVSGGPDSMALLHLASKFLPKKNLLTMTIDHGWRSESAVEAEGVKILSESLHISCIKREIKNSSGRSEAEARKSRYLLLEGLRKKEKFDFIITAHHADDQLETFFQRVVRGSGPLKIWGMDELNGHILRPLLNNSKQELVSYCRENKVKYFLDETNNDTRYQRNLVRLKLLPLLREMNPRIEETLSGNISLGKELAAFLQPIIQKEYAKIVKTGILTISLLLKQPRFLQYEILFRYLQVKTEKEVKNQAVMELLAAITKEGCLDISFLGQTFRKEYDKFYLAQKPSLEKMNLKLEIGQTAKFNDFHLSVLEKKAAANENNILIPKDLAYNLVVRTWVEGDRIATRSGTKKIQDVFTDAKIPVADRGKWPIILSGEEIIWVPNVTASKYSLNNHSTKGVVIEARHATEQK